MPPRHPGGAGASRADHHADKRALLLTCATPLQRPRADSYLASLRSPDWNHRATGFKRVNPIGPMIHHYSALSEIFCPVISCAYGIALLMGKLTLNHIRSATHFIQRG